MSHFAHDVRYSLAEYVAFERTSNVKHEYLDGKIYAMAGGTPEHAALPATVSGLLFGALRGGPCRVYSSDLRVKAGDLLTYPDVTVVCGPPQTDPEDEHTLLNPRVIVEVTSPSTEDYDRREKLEHYRGIPSLQAVLIVSHREARVTLFTRVREGSTSSMGTGGLWMESSIEAGGSVPVAALDTSLSVDDIYAHH